jgi:hypothetical protein
MARNVDASGSVHIPTPAEDKPSWIKVGIVAAIGFAVGVVGPRVAGIRLGPNAPGESKKTVEAPPAAITESKVEAQPPLPPPTPVPSAPTVPPTSGSNSPRIAVSRGTLLSCRTEDGETKKGHKQCGALPAFETVATGRLKRLGDCPASKGAEGKLKAVLTLDFEKEKIDVSVGKTSTAGNLDTFGMCLRMSFDKVSLANVAHEHARYTLLYNVDFVPREGSDAGVERSLTSASGVNNPSLVPRAQIAWEVAIVRDAPRSGKLVARLPRGTEVQVGAGQEGWFKIRYGEGNANEGWVYRGAIGR